MVGICRLCASLRKTDMLTTITDTNHVVCRKLRECCRIDIQMDDTLPRCICCDCIEALQQAHSFYIKVHESQDSLITLFSPTSRVTSVVTVITAKPPTLAESLAPAIHSTTNIGKETSTECVGGDTKLKTDVQLTEKEENCEECETNIILDEDEVNLMLDKVEDDIDDEAYLIEKIIGRKCGVESEEEFSSDVTKAATSDSLNTHEFKKTEPVKLITIKTVNLNSVKEEEEQEELEEEQEVEKVLEEIQEGEDFQELELIQLQLSSQDADGVKPDTWNSYPWLCYLCSVEKTSFIDLLVHCQVAHDLNTMNEMQFMCFDCQKVCPRYYNFVNHVRFRHRSTLSLCCDVCNMICSDFKYLASHRQEQHTKNSDHPFILLCGDCGHGFKDQNSRQIHFKTHLHSGTNFECTDCGKVFARYAFWKAHQKVHSEIKEFSCEQCGKSFRQKINLITHILTHVTDKPYECSTCQKKFKTPNSLEKHMTTHTSVKNFKCDYCENMFRTKDSKLSHERTHTGERPYKCEYCDRSFRFRSTFIGHQNIHTGKRPYSCEPCNHNFTNWSNYNKHMKRIHGNESTAKAESTKRRRRTVKDNTISDGNAHFEYEALDEVVDSPDSVVHQDVTYTLSTENIDNTSSRIIEISTISALNSESEIIDEHLEQF